MDQTKEKPKLLQQRTRVPVPCTSVCPLSSCRATRPREGQLRITGRRPPSGNQPRNNSTKIYIGTYNARTIFRETDLATIIGEKNNIKCDILGLCETGRSMVSASSSPDDGRHSSTWST
ncbi:hypothetical protein PO909_024167 [Leuciscus waleckii]